MLARLSPRKLVRCVCKALTALLTRGGRSVGVAGRWTHRNAEDVALVGGYASIAGGCFWIYGPAGLIVAGVLAAGTSLVLARVAPAATAAELEDGALDDIDETTVGL